MTERYRKTDFGQFVLGLFNRTVFPYDKCMSFDGALAHNGHEMGNLIVDLLTKAGFDLDHEKSSDAGYFANYVFSYGERSNFESDDWHTDSDVIEIEYIVSLFIARPDFHRKKRRISIDELLFTPESSIDVECEILPF